ncbi:hypothetical protein KUCAC02_026694 [Chaenocephalus aceratus]|nr:hypothetical protein KUCAC02_026694 [Chaenocephalus aceratus]
MGDIPHGAATTRHVYPLTQSYFGLFHNTLISRRCSGSRSVGVRQIYFPPQHQSSVSFRISPNPPGALANLSSPSVFHAAWGTLACSPNELPLLILFLNPAITSLSETQRPQM